MGPEVNKQGIFIGYYCIMMKQINIEHVGNLHTEWFRGLDFYGLELNFMQERLDEVASGNTGREASERIDYFQNEIIIHRNFIDELRHYIHENVKKMGNELLKTKVFVDENVAAEHEKLHEQYLTEEKMIKDLRQEFNRFAAEWL